MLSCLFFSYFQELNLAEYRNSATAIGRSILLYADLAKKAQIEAWIP
jgi:hypothetical protein